MIVYIVRIENLLISDKRHQPSMDQHFIFSAYGFSWKIFSNSSRHLVVFFGSVFFFQKGLLAHRSLVGDTSLIFHFFVDGF